MTNNAERVDVVGFGLNAMDTLIRLPHFPSFNTKVKVVSVEQRAGGQVGSAMVACRRWGLKARYVGSVGDDVAGDVHREEFKQEGVEARLVVVPGVRSQFAYILVDESSGERTILWGRDAALAVRPEEIDRGWIEQARLLHVDGHDAQAAAEVARWAREAGIPVTADLDNIYPGTEALLEQTDYLLSSSEFPSRLIGEDDLVEALPALVRQYGCRVAGATLGEAGALAWDGERYFHSPGFIVEPVDTTGAGDIFHSGYIYALLAGWDTGRCMEFACAAAALSCTRPGARGGIFPVDEILRFVAGGRRREPLFEPEVLNRAAARYKK